jgi:hypothetical protein
MSEINIAAVLALRSIIDSLPPKQEDFCPCCGARGDQMHTRMCEDKANENLFQDYLDDKEAEWPVEEPKIREFLYHSNKKGQLQSWSTDFNTAAFFMYKDVPYMLINGAWGVVCFNLNRAFWATDKTVIGTSATSRSNAFDYLVAWPTADMQRLLLNLV